MPGGMGFLGIGSSSGASSGGSTSPSSTGSPTDSSGGGGTGDTGSTPSSTSSTSPGDTSSGGTGSSTGSDQSGQTFGGGGIIGFSPASPRKSILIYKKKEHYNEWEFTYDPISDMQTVSGGSAGGNGLPKLKRAAAVVLRSPCAFNENLARILHRPLDGQIRPPAPDHRPAESGVWRPPLQPVRRPALHVFAARERCGLARPRV
jgi:hypothetical protein